MHRLFRDLQKCENPDKIRVFSVTTMVGAEGLEPPTLCV